MTIFEIAYAKTWYPDFPKALFTHKYRAVLRRTCKYIFIYPDRKSTALFWEFSQDLKKAKQPIYYTAFHPHRTINAETRDGSVLIPLNKI
jgi:hypothetical protein